MKLQNIETNKPPIARKSSLSKMHKSSEKPLKNLASLSGEGRENGSTIESSENLGGRFTPNFRSRGRHMMEGTSPYVATCIERAERQSCLSTTNDKESFDNRHKSSEPRVRNRFSELMESYDSEESKEIIF